ncbi:diguanylate cyclase [Pseudolabrys sp. Root1462]|uniref:bifunctional diguanylate cyclase/phosphodiesterase n=1 Tax=Pseudolabrys sp. Root1462 TaxID=1736466 RepID=UPI000703AD21|nr:bifunctional diguanylate cyclase/phosphodiesterase [Pseudolabrys sp. Root1462]KQY97427.1 diguanylate cyclase [Pseudolabrys sp. Root1462]
MSEFGQNDRPDAGEILRMVGEAAYEWRLDSDGLTWSAHAAAVLGIADTAAIETGAGFARVIDASGGVSRLEAIQAANRHDSGDGVSYEAQYAFKRPDGSTTWLEDTGRWFAGADGKPARACGVVRAIDARHEREQELIKLAKFDSLTGELNRTAVIDVLSATLDETIRFRSSCGFLLAAIDNLGQLNDSYGFDITEEVIAQVAKRIRARVRGKDYFGRISGNKFAVVLTKCTPDELTVAADRLLAGVRDEPIVTSAGPVAVTITIGGVTAPRHAGTLSEVLSRSQDALASARDKRLGSFAAYRPSVERDALRKESLRATDEIIAALNDRRISLAFEPVANAAQHSVAFYECLIRAHREDGVQLAAGDIIPAAERLGLVRMLDHRVLELVVDELVAAPHLCTSVNVSPASALDPGWWSGLGAMLRANAGVGERLIVEITETAAIHDIDDARGFVSRAKDFGCRIAIDDFGAGNTSFRNLRRLGVDIIKIDGAFVQNLTKSEDDRAFVQTMIDLAHRLRIRSVAEWVQDEEAARLLSGWGCDYLQGAFVGLASSERPWLPEKKSKSAAGV